MSEADSSNNATHTGDAPPEAVASPRRSTLRREAAGWAASLTLHLAVLTVLAFVTLSLPADHAEPQLLAVVAEIGDEVEAPADLLDHELTDIEMPADAAAVVVDVQIAEIDTVSAFEEPMSLAMQPTLDDLSDDGWLATNLTATTEMVVGREFLGRGATARALLAAEHGGTAGSEQAVNLGLAWLAKHQRPDGSWNFDHQLGPCQSRCGNPGTLDRCTTGATGLALLCFLGAGHTQQTGDYRRVVSGGLTYLAGRMKVSQAGGSLTEPGGRMYDHGICTIAICEAFAMTGDKRLYQPAQLASQFTANAQDPVGGGWRYFPRMPGDTSAVGWQLMALKSARASGIEVPSVVWRRAGYFLDSVAKRDGAVYGYNTPGAASGTTAVGLLCRIYLGWPRDHEPLIAGADMLAEVGPSADNMYYNYYATQVLHQLGGPRWREWNRKLRQQLVDTQEREGHEQGSWFIHGGDDDGASGGGRLYITTMNIMTLEVYYRYLPIYRNEAEEVE